MKNMKKVLSLLLALVMVFALAAGCSNGDSGVSGGVSGDASGDVSGGDAGDLKLTVGYVTISGSAPWGALVGTSFIEYAEAAGWTVRYLDAETDVEKLNEHVQTMIDAKVDAIAIFGGDPDINSDNAKKAADAGIPMFMAALDVTERGREYVKACVGPDQVEMGKKIGEYLIENEGGADAGKLVVQISGVPFLQDYIDREAGFNSAMSGTNYDVKEAQYAFSDRSEAKKFMEQYIQAYGDGIDVLMGFDDDLTMGGVAAIEEAGMTGQISVYSITGQNDAIQAVKDGAMTLTVMNRASDIGAELLVAMTQYFSTGSTEYYHYTPLTYITADNVDDFIGTGEF